jgi:hypothetical protein
MDHEQWSIVESLKFKERGCSSTQRLAICSDWLLKTYLSTVIKRNIEDKTLYLHVTPPLRNTLLAVAGPFSSL